MENSIKSLQTQDLLQAKYTEGTQPLTKNQKSALIFIYAKILNQVQKSGKKDWYTISIDEMMDHLDGTKGGNQARLVWDQLKDLNRTQIIIPYVSDGELRERLTHVVSEVDRPVTASGAFKIKISDLVLENIQYRKGIIYRWIELKYARKLSSPKHIDLYEALKASENMEYWTISLQDLKATVNLHNKYEKFSQLKKWFLTPASIDISKNTDLKISWKENRGKRSSVESITFRIKKNKPQNNQPQETHINAQKDVIDSKLKARGVMNASKFGLDDKYWIKALDIEPEDAPASYIITTAKRLSQENQIKKEKFEQQTKDNTLVEMHAKYWDENKDMYSSDLIKTGSYLEDRSNGKIFLMIKETFISDIAEYKKNESDSYNNQRETNIFVEAMRLMTANQARQKIVNRINQKKDQGIYTNWSIDEMRHKGTNPEAIAVFLVGRASKENQSELEKIYSEIYGEGWRKEAKLRLERRGVNL